MKKHLFNLLKHPLIAGSGIVFIGSFFGNIFHFLFNLFMSQQLSVSDYGILASISSLVIIPGLLSTSITPAIVRFAGKYFANNELALAKDFFIKVTKSVGLLGVIALVVFSLFSYQISSYFHLQEHQGLIILAGAMIGVGFIGTVNTAFLQAKLAFKSMSFFNFFSGLIKFILGAIFVLSGLEVFGSVFALFVSGVIFYFCSLLPLRPVLIAKNVTADFKIQEVILYAIPSAIALFSITAISTVDILLVKHFFPPVTAGLYAGLSLVGKVIFYFSSPIGTVMFPLIVQKHARRENYNNILLLSLLLVLIPSLALTIFFFLFPNFVVSFFLKNAEYLQIIPYLGVFGVFITLYSLLTVLTNFFLSIKKTAIYIPLLIGALLQVVFISLFHTSFLQIITISISITSILLLFFIGYYIYIMYHDEKGETSES